MINFFRALFVGPTKEQVKRWKQWEDLKKTHNIEDRGNDRYGFPMLKITPKPEYVQKRWNELCEIAQEVFKKQAKEKRLRKKRKKKKI